MDRQGIQMRRLARLRQYMFVKEGVRKPSARPRAQAGSHDHQFGRGNAAGKPDDPFVGQIGDRQCQMQADPRALSLYLDIKLQYAPFWGAIFPRNLRKRRIRHKEQTGPDFGPKVDFAFRPALSQGVQRVICRRVGADFKVVCHGLRCFFDFGYRDRARK